MRVWIAVFLGAAMACAKAEPPPPPAAPTVDTVAVNQGLDDFWARWSRTLTDSSTAEGYASLYSVDARLDIPGMPPILGRTALETVLRPIFAARDYVGAESNRHTTLVVNNDLALQGGTFIETYVENKKTLAEYGRFAGSIARGPDGQWRLVYIFAVVDSTVAGR